MLSIQFGVAKTNKYASRESGDTLEIVERPVGMGGFTAVLVDGQGSGKSAKGLSNFVTANCVTLLKQGVRDGAVARAANDQLYSYKSGQVSATLNLITVDFVTNSLVITRNNPQSVFICTTGLTDDEETPNDEPLTILTLDDPCVPLGIYPRARPILREFELKAGLVAVAFTDGISGAGTRFQQNEKISINVFDFLRQKLVRPPYNAQSIADSLLETALAADRYRPQDDMSVVAVSVHNSKADDETIVPRRLTMNITAN